LNARAIFALIVSFHTGGRSYPNTQNQHIGSMDPDKSRNACSAAAMPVRVNSPDDKKANALKTWTSTFKITLF
jgi:hypothetical protein